MNGILVIDKPAGPTSHDVVAVVRRALGVDRVGHTGTLDPLASGVLPLVVGRATRLASFMSGSDKAYIARVRFGRTTPTYDAEGLDRAGAGEPSGEPLPDAAAVAAMLPAFGGTYAQMPPPFSAKKVGGTAAYKLARKQQPVELKAVEVTVREIALDGYDEGTGVAHVRLVCTAGFYVRSLAHDLGQRLGCGAYLDGLQRTLAAGFSLADAIPLETIVREGCTAGARLVPLDRLLPHLPSVTLSDEGARRAGHGNALRREDVRSETASLGAGGSPARIRLLDGAGTLLGLAEAGDDGLLRPVIVLV